MADHSQYARCLPMLGQTLHRVILNDNSTPPEGLHKSSSSLAFAEKSTEVLAVMSRGRELKAK
jgi:hypothetical protein